MKRSDTPLEMKDISFAFGRAHVLDAFSLTPEKGKVTVLAAPNGAGKSTALWLAAGLLRPAQGEVRLFGRDPFNEREILGTVGFLAEGAPMPPDWTGAQVLDFQRGTFPRFDEEECKRLLERFKLDLSQKVKRLSRGERGKLALLTVLSVRPELLLLDEPTLGLDVATRRLLASELLGRLTDGGATVLLASHEIAEAERTADRFIFLEKGHVSINEEVSALLERHRLLEWDEGVTPPPPGLDLLPLTSRMAKRALARRWDERQGASFVRGGGRVGPADLETIYLSFTGELSHA